MKILREIISLVSRNRIKEIKILDSGILSDKASKLKTLYDLIADGKVLTDEQAQDILYEGKKGGAYRVLKGELIDRIHNNAFFINIQDTKFAEYDKVRLTLWKKVSLIQIFAGFGLSNTAGSLAHKTLNKAIKYTLNEIAIICASTLKHYLAHAGKFKEMSELDDLMTKSKEYYYNELDAESYYIEIASGFGQSVSTKRMLLKRTENYIKQLSPHVNQIPSFKFHKYFFQLSALYYSIKGDYTNALAEYNKLERLVSKKDQFYQPRIIALANMNKLACLLHLPNSEVEANKAILTCLEIYEKGKNNWFLFHEVYFIYLMRKGEYGKAFGIFSKVVYTKKFQSLRGVRAEKWKIFEAYINFLLETGLVVTSQEDGVKKKRFRLEKFLNEVPIFSKDKRGYNIAILVIQILYFIQRKQFNRIIDKTETLANYKNKYLKRKEDLRSVLFIKLMLILERNSFKYSANDRTFKKVEIQLDQTQYNFEGTPDDPEILPYEKLWDICISLLENQ